jgi:septum formation inhibitor-activating ATPase MinD
VPIGISNAKTLIFNTVVDVTIRIGEKRTDQKYILPASPQTLDKKVSVTLRGTRSLLSKIRPADLKIIMIKTESGADIPQTLLPAEFQDVVFVKETRFL